MTIGERFVFALHVFRFPLTTGFDFQHANVLMLQGLTRSGSADVFTANTASIFSVPIWLE